MPIIPALKSLRQEYHEFMASRRQEYHEFMASRRHR
jgi:hypothetical protein